MTSSSPATPSFFRSWRMSVTASTCWVSLSLAFLWISQLSHYVYWPWIWHSLTQSCLSVEQSIITLCVLTLNLTLTHSVLPFCGAVNYHATCTKLEFDTHSLSLAFLWINQLSHYVYWNWIWHSLIQSCLSVAQSIITLCVVKLTHSLLPFCGSVNYDTMCSETDSLSLAFLWLSELWHYV